jgi:hypothetical protein
LAALLLLFVLDALIFRTASYEHLVRPYSFAGALIQRSWLAEARKKSGAPIVAVIGDSRVREGFSAKLFDQMAENAALPLRALNLGVSGSTLRVWYYLLKHIDPDCRAFDTIVVALPSYWDEDYTPDLADNKLDLQILLPVLRATDIPQFVSSFEDRVCKLDALLAALFETYGYRRDLKDFLSHPLARIADCAYFEKFWQSQDYDYMGDKRSMAGLKVLNNQLVNVPSFLEPTKLDRLKQLTFPGSLGPDYRCCQYFPFWLGQIVQRYKGSPTKILVLCIPNKPVPVCSIRPKIDRTIESLSCYENVHVLPVDAFSLLENPCYFFDDVHLNAEGRKKFTEMLTDLLLDRPSMMTRLSAN